MHTRGWAVQPPIKANVELDPFPSSFLKDLGFIAQLYSVIFWPLLT